jgi:hypothetical protein
MTNITKPFWRGIEFRAENIEDRKVIPFEPLRVQQIRERLSELDNESAKNIDEQVSLEQELNRLGYSRG